jgi:SAM-dependent methyltransferase
VLPLTGERTVPGVPAENYWFRRHEAAYAWLLPRVDGFRVLEVGSGEGYGTAMLATAAGSILGIDYDAAAVAHAVRSYSGARFARANLAALPVRTGAVDRLVSMQVIEHVWDHAQFVRECARVVTADATIVMTTPNRLTFSPGHERPVNPFHTHEFVADELTTLFDRCGLAVDEVLGVHRGQRLVDLDERHGSLVEAQLATAPAEWSARLAADVASIRLDDFVVEDGRLDECLDLVVVARRLE